MTQLKSSFCPRCCERVSNLLYPDTVADTLCPPCVGIYRGQDSISPSQQHPWLDLPDASGKWWRFSGEDLEIVDIVNVDSGVFLHDGVVHGLREPAQWLRLEVPALPPKPVDITKWHPGSPNKSGIWWVSCPNWNMPRCVVVSIYEIKHVSYGFGDGARCAYVGPIPELPREQDQS